jgi:hypothetical protein
LFSLDAAANRDGCDGFCIGTGLQKLDRPDLLRGPGLEAGTLARAGRMRQSSFAVRDVSTACG